MGPLGIFFRGFLEHPKMVGSVIPSSRATIDVMLSKVDWEQCDLFVEYGPGVGTFCPHILERMKPGARLIAIDTNPRFVDYLRREIEDRRFSAVLGSASDVEDIVHRAGYAHADHVLSGLPVSSLPEAVGEAIVGATYRVLRPGGSFMTYQFKPAARDLTREKFDRLDTGYVWRNIPPCLMTWGWKE
jgi:phospholipid N-methyltransferase